MCHNLELFQGQGGGPSVLTSLLGQGQVVRHFNFFKRSPRHKYYVIQI